MSRATILVTLVLFGCETGVTDDEEREGELEELDGEDELEEDPEVVEFEVSLDDEPGDADRPTDFEAEIDPQAVITCCGTSAVGWSPNGVSGWQWTTVDPRTTCVALHNYTGYYVSGTTSLRDYMGTCKGEWGNPSGGLCTTPSLSAYGEISWGTVHACSI